jgi:hypothetical protein
MSHNTIITGVIKTSHCGNNRRLILQVDKYYNYNSMHNIHTHTHTQYLYGFRIVYYYFHIIPIYRKTEYRVHNIIMRIIY